MEILDIIMKRRSIRKYTEQVLGKELLTDLLKAAMAAPTACNNQPWEFIVITDPGTIQTFRERLRSADYNAPAAIAICHNPALGNAPGCDRYWIQDLSAATENILIAAAGMGLGTVWLGVFPNDDKVSVVRGILSIPEGVIPLCVIYVGYPGEDKPSRTQYEENRVHWEAYR